MSGPQIIDPVKIVDLTPLMAELEQHQFDARAEVHQLRVRANTLQQAGRPETARLLRDAADLLHRIDRWSTKARDAVLL